MKIVVLTESKTGNTHKAGAMIGASAEAAGADVTVCSVRHPDLDALSEADLVFVGTWCGGIIFFGHHPGSAGAIRQNIPSVPGKKVASFTTYAYHAGKVQKRFAKLLNSLGMDVVASENLRRDLLPAGVDAFVERAMAAA